MSVLQSRYSKRLPVFQNFCKPSQHLPSNFSRNLLVSGLDPHSSIEDTSFLFTQFGPLHVFESLDLCFGRVTLSYFDIRHARSMWKSLHTFYQIDCLQDPVDPEFIDYLIFQCPGISQQTLFSHFSGRLMGVQQIQDLLLVRFFDRRDVWNLQYQLSSLGTVQKHVQARPGSLVWEKQTGHPGPQLEFLVQHPFKKIDLNIEKKTPVRKKEDNRLKFVINLQKINGGEDKRTTVMVKNIPNKYSQAMLVEAINQQHGGTYDFLYLPIDFKNHCNMGYAFVNFLDPLYIPAFYLEFDGKPWGRFNSEKICALAYARIQGRRALEKHFRSSTIMSQGEHMRPLIISKRLW